MSLQAIRPIVILHSQILSRSGRICPKMRFNWIRDIKALEEFYLKEGYPRSVTSPKRVYYDEDNNEVSILINIEAGIHVIVSFEGEYRVFSGELKRSF